MTFDEIEDRLQNLERFAGDAAQLLNDLNERVTLLQKAVGVNRPQVTIREDDIVKEMEQSGDSWETSKERLLNARTEETLHIPV